jgi:hypothetical protein
MYLFCLIIRVNLVRNNTTEICTWTVSASANLRLRLSVHNEEGCCINGWSSLLHTSWKITDEYRSLVWITDSEIANYSEKIPSNATFKKKSHFTFPTFMAWQEVAFWTLKIKHVLQNEDIYAATWLWRETLMD